ncbi:MAG: NAD-glutamate dehydrogenase domain-containing protein, partial [Alphaproteobacteria bacterium]
GITARGSWESVARHFREMGKDIQKEDFTVIGVGDMSGDVFGNGMLLSRHIRLIGAFNHLHIFIDPDPDPAQSHAERKRLFETPGTAWTDYAPKLISRGGGVFDRSAKAIDLTPEMKSLLSVQSDKLTPNEVIRHLLVAEAELLWFGGIGTFVRAGFETDAEAGDRANDAIRVTAGALDCAVIGEGGNLGITQNARIEYALAGGRINTDAIDNSGGVDASDHEVNIKILLGDVVARGDMTMKQRDNLLARMTDEVGALVLRDNYQQPQALTVIEAQGLDGLDGQERLMRALERKGLLDRSIEFLPDEEALAERREAGKGLARPELAVLFAYAKIALYEDLLASDLPDDEELFDEILLYFPKPLRGKHRNAIRRHRLRREIIATAVANSIVNRMGPCFFNDLVDETGLPASQIARVYAVTRAVFGLRDVWTAVEAADNRMPAALQTEMLATSIRLAEGVTKWFLRGEQPIDIARIRAAYAEGIGVVVGDLERMLSPRLRADLKRRAGELRKAGAGTDLARRIARIERLDAACDIVAIAGGGGVAVADSGRVYFALGERFGFDWLRRAAARLVPATVWEKQAQAAIQDGLRRQQGEFAMRVLDAAGSGAVAETMTKIWIDAHAHAVEGVDDMLAEFAKAESVDLAMLTVATGRLRALVSG